jgi:hypothetical protein
MASNAGEGWVYFIQSEEAASIKIGWTNVSPSRRLGACQTGCPTELELLAAMPGSRGLERALHRRFDEYRIRGEWFADAPEIWAYLMEQIELRPGELIGPIPEWIAMAKADQPRQEHQMAVRAAYFARLERAKAAAACGQPVPIAVFIRTLPEPPTP